MSTASTVGVNCGAYESTLHDVVLGDSIGPILRLGLKCCAVHAEPMDKGQMAAEIATDAKCSGAP